MADPATGKRYYHGSSTAPPPIPPHHQSHDQLSVAVALQDVPQLTALVPAPGTSGGHEEVSIEMDDAAQEENQDPHFNMSFEFEETFRAHKAASIAETFQVFLKTSYECTIYGVYHLVVIATGLCIVLFWAMLNGLTIYCQSWCLSPITRYILVFCQGMCLPAYELIKGAMASINEIVGTLTKGCCKKRS